MTNADYKATPEQWAFLRDCAANGPTPLRDQSAAQNSCILELRARVEALEAAQRPRVFTADEVAPIVVSAAPAPAGSLVERVADALADEFQPSGTWHDEARAAIREVAAWLREQAPGFLTGDELIEAAHLISREAGQ
jgi:hypothetical protein